jgi:hypothetical protein
MKDDPKNRNFRQLFRKYTTAQKPAYMSTELVFNNILCLPHVFIKKSVLKRLDRLLQCKSRIASYRNDADAVYIL